MEENLPQSLLKNQHKVFAHLWETIKERKKNPLLKKTPKSINYHFPGATQDNEERSYSQLTGSENKRSQTSRAALETVGGGGQFPFSHLKNIGRGRD